MNLHILHPVKNRKTDVPDFATEWEHLSHNPIIHLAQHGNFKLRSIRAEDEQRMIKFHENLSEESIYLRYFEHISLDTRTLHERLARICTNTAESHAIVAEKHGRSHAADEIAAVGRLTITDVPAVANFATLISDEIQDTELPYELMKRLIAIARAHGFHTLTGELLVADHGMLNICRKLGFDLHTVPEDGMVKVTYPL